MLSSEALQILPSYAFVNVGKHGLAGDSDPSPLEVLDRCLLEKPESLFQTDWVWCQSPSLLLMGCLRENCLALLSNYPQRMRGSYLHKSISSLENIHMEKVLHQIRT